MAPPSGELPVVSADRVTLAGERGAAIARNIAFVCAGLEEPQPPLSRRPDGGLQLRVTPETLAVLGGRAVVAGSETPNE